MLATSISPGDLCTLDGAKSYLSPTLGSPSDPILQKFIGRASTWIGRYLSRHLTLGAFSERRNGTGSVQIATRHYPIVAVQAVWIDDAQVEVAPITTDAQSLVGGGYLETRRFIYLRGGVGPTVSRTSFRPGVQNVLLEYQAGYITPGILAVNSQPPWAAQSPVAAGAVLAPSGAGILLRALTPGSTGAAAPAWPSEIGVQVSDGQVTWLSIEPYLGIVPGAALLPDAIEVAAMELVALMYRNRDRVGDSGTGLGPERVNYFMGAMSKMTKESLEVFRDVVPLWEPMP
jgi:hypothetical protein